MFQANSGHGILEVLNEYPSIEITLTNLIEILDTMKPRW